MNPAPKRRQHTHPPVPQLIPHPLNHNVAIIRNNDGRQLLIRQIAQHILRRHRIQIMLRRQPRHRHTPRHLAQLPHQRANPPPKLQRPPRLIPMPERHLPRLARSRRHQHAVMRNLIDPPRRSAQNETSRPSGSQTPSPHPARPPAPASLSRPQEKPHTSRDPESSRHSESQSASRPAAA